MENRNRQTNIELLKVFAIVLIILCHSMPSVAGNTCETEIPSYLFDLSKASHALTQNIMVVMKYGGQIGNAIFIICSSWFLLNDYNNEKYNIKKVINIALTCVVVSLLFLFVFLANHRYSVEIIDIIKQFFPILFENNWYVSCYILLYLMYPGLNIIICKLSQKQLFILCSILFFMYNFINFIIPGKYYYTNLIGFVCIYFYIAYMKKYMKNLSNNKKVNGIVLLISIIFHLTIILLTCMIGLKFSQFHNWLTRWNVFMNPFIIMIAITSFNFFRNINVKNNRFVNYISKSSLIIYIVHCNYFIMNYFKFDFYKYIYYSYGYSKLLLWIVVVACLLFFMSTLFVILYNLFLNKIICLISYKVGEFLTRIYEKIYYYIQMID